MRSRAATGSSEPKENPMEQGGEPAASADKKPTGFAGVDVFGGTPPKEGSEYTIKVVAIDPETREAEFEIVDSMEKETPPEPSKASETPTEEPTMDLS